MRVIHDMESREEIIVNSREKNGREERNIKSGIWMNVILFLLFPVF